MYTLELLEQGEVRNKIRKQGMQERKDRETNIVAHAMDKTRAWALVMAVQLNLPESTLQRKDANKSLPPYKGQL